MCDCATSKPYGMYKIYMRLLGFARPIKRYAIPYGIFSLLYAVFNTLTFV